MSESSFALFNEESSITGGKSVSEIVQILRTNASLKLKVRDLDDHEDVEEVPNRTSQIFPWIKRFTAQCKDVILDPNIRKLDELISTFFRHIDDTAKQCYKRPKRAYKLKTRISSFLQTFNMIYNQLKQPLEHTCYLEKMSDVMAVYIDIELKSSRRGREHPKKIAERICTSLFIFLDKSIEHILDTVLKSKFFIKKYSEICCPIMARVLRERPGRLYEASYIRYILSFKLWKKLAGKDHYATINKEAVTKLTPPPDFTEKLKTGLFSNVLPYVSKSEKDRITLFFMQSPFNVKKKAQVFLKEEKKMQPNLDLERSLLFDDDLQISFLDDDNDDLNEQPDDDLMNDMWNNLVDNEEDCFDSLLIPMDIIETKEDEDIIVDLKRTKGNEKPKKTLKDRPTNGVLKTSLKKRKVTKPNNNTLMKNFSGKDAVMDFIRNDLTIPITSVSTKEDNPIVSCVKSEDSLVSFINSPEMKQPKPCATVEPEQCREITDSVKNFTEVSPVRAPRNPTISMAEPSGQEPTVTKAGEESCETDDKVEYIEAIPSTTVSSNLEDTTIVENFVAEEVVIGSDIEQDSGCSFLFLDTDSKMVQNDILSVIGITKGSTSFCNAEIVVNEESIMKDDRRQIVIDSTVLNDSNVIKTKENVSGSPDNQFLYSITPSTESYVPFSRRQDSYACNDMFLQRLLSDPTPVDDGSDDDSRYQDRRRFAGGGKLPAFREQTEESKSENDEDFDALTPSSDSLQQSPLDTSLESTRLQQEALESTPPSPRDVDPHPQDKKEKTLNQEDPKLSQMKELTIPLSRGEVLTANDQVCDVSEDKIRPPGMLIIFDEKSHNTTDKEYQNYIKHQVNQETFYKKAENILETNPVPDPLKDLCIECYPDYSDRCHCRSCERLLRKIKRNHKKIVKLRKERIVECVDKKNKINIGLTDIKDMVSKILYCNDRDESMLKSIGDTLPSSESLSLEDKIGTTIKRKKDKDESNQLQITVPTIDKPESVKCSEKKKEYASLPPKKRKAFTIEKYSNTEQACQNDKFDCSSKSTESKSCKEKLETGFANSLLMTDITKSSSPSAIVGYNRFSPVKIKAIDGRYCVLSEFPSEYGESVVESDLPSEHIPKSQRKCSRKKRKHERKEKKRLKKLKKLEEGLHN